MHRLVANLLSGVRLAALRPAVVSVTLGQLLALIALGWIAALINDWRTIDGAFRFSPWGLACEAARSYLWLASVAIVCLQPARDAQSRFLRLAIALAAADITVWLAWLMLTWMGPRFAGEWYFRYSAYSGWLFFSWQVAIFFNVWARLGFGRILRGLVFSMLYAVALYANLHLLPDYPLVEARENDRGVPALNIEDIYYQQATLLEDATKRLRAGSPGVIDLHVIALGGYGGEDVFKREAIQVSRILADRFDSDERTVQLINNRGSVARLPLANAPNLIYVLEQLTRKMQRDEDILFLFMTSHGSEEGEFALELGELGLNNLRPQALRRILDDAGIKWRVIVVSACYSGYFIDALKSPTTLVITAAAKNKSSFGCAHENHWTYFGEAYFQDALVQTHSFTRAFELARSKIAAREQREHKEPSEPQMSLGAEVKPILERFEARFDAPAQR